MRADLIALFVIGIDVVLYEKLRATLSAEQIKLFDEFVEQYSYRHSLIAESYYVRGFKFGVRLAVECFDLSDVNTRS